MTASRRLPDSVTARLTAMHGEPHRRYHTQAHIDALLVWLERYRSLAAAPDRIDAAIWFHDAVYDPRRLDNEERSAELAERELSALGWAEAEVTAVAAMVRATQHHDAPDSAADTRFFLDLDLSILGQSPTHYAAYRDAIRAEYGWVETERYREGRRQVLQRFVARQHIYFTPTLRDAWEASARRNLAQELAELADIDNR